MNDEQAKQLVQFLSDFLGQEPISQETLRCFSIYKIIRDAARDGGAEGLFNKLQPMAEMEENENYITFENTQYKCVRNILFGDLSLTPPLMGWYPTLCKWRLSLVEEK